MFASLARKMCVGDMNEATSSTLVLTTTTSFFLTASTIFTAVVENSWKLTASRHKHTPSEAHFKLNYKEPWLTQKQRN